VSANLAEGAARRSDAAFVAYLDVAAAPASEADYHLLLARDLGYLDPAEHGELARQLTRVRQMLAGLRRKVGRCSGKMVSPLAPASVAVASRE
jgi:four helix bundle protein